MPPIVDPPEVNRTPWSGPRTVSLLRPPGSHRMSWVGAPEARGGLDPLTNAFLSRRRRGLFGGGLIGLFVDLAQASATGSVGVLGTYAQVLVVARVRPRRRGLAQPSEHTGPDR